MKGPTPNIQTYIKSIENARFPTFQLDDHGRTDRQTGRTKDLHVVKNLGKGTKNTRESAISKQKD